MQKLFLHTVLSILLSIVFSSVALADFTVTGRVLNDCASGVQPLEGALVELVLSPSSPIPSSVGEDVYTDSDGNFSVVVAEGDYSIVISYFNHVLFAEAPIKQNYGNIHVSEPSACKDLHVYMPVILANSVPVAASSTIFDYANVTEVYNDDTHVVYIYDCFFYFGTRLQVIAQLDQRVPPYNTFERVVWVAPEAAIGGVGCEGSPALITDPTKEVLRKVRFSADTNVITVNDSDFRLHFTLFIMNLFR